MNLIVMQVAGVAPESQTLIKVLVVRNHLFPSDIKNCWGSGWKLIAVELSCSHNFSSTLPFLVCVRIEVMIAHFSERKLMINLSSSGFNFVVRVLFMLLYVCAGGEHGIEEAEEWFLGELFMDWLHVLAIYSKCELHNVLFTVFITSYFIIVHSLFLFLLKLNLRMPILDLKVISETLRMANIINAIWRKALRDVEIKGQHVLYTLWTLILKPKPCLHLLNMFFHLTK